MDLVKPAQVYLASYVDALKRGWSPDGTPESAAERLKRIDADPQGFLASESDPHGSGASVRLPNGALIPSPPGVARWIWDGGFCGRIWLRWSGTGVELPPGWLGHIAYEIVPWKRGRGYATRALERMLAEARKSGFAVHRCGSGG